MFRVDCRHNRPISAPFSGRAQFACFCEDLGESVGEPVEARARTAFWKRASQCCHTGTTLRIAQLHRTRQALEARTQCTPGDSPSITHSCFELFNPKFWRATSTYAPLKIPGCYFGWVHTRRQSDFGARVTERSVAVSQLELRHLPPLPRRTGYGSSRKRRCSGCGTNGSRFPPVSYEARWGQQLNVLGHADYWQQLRRSGAVPGEVEYDEPPRGRVVYDTIGRKYLLYADSCILSKKAHSCHDFTSLIRRHLFNLASV